MSHNFKLVSLGLTVAAVVACSGNNEPMVGTDVGPRPDAGQRDASTSDVRRPEDTGLIGDIGNIDVGIEDGGTDEMEPDDAGTDDAGVDDAGTDDAGVDDAGADGAGADMASDTGMTSLTAEIEFPRALTATYHDQIVVRGTTDTTGTVTSVTYGGVSATSSDGFANWEATIGLQQGVNMLQGEATTADGTVTPLRASEVHHLVTMQGGFGTAWDAVDEQLYYVDRETLKVGRIDASTHTVRFVADLSDFVTMADTTPPIDLAFDGVNEAVYVVSRVPTAVKSSGVWRYDLQTETWSEVSTASRGSGPAWVGPGRITLDVAAGRAFVHENMPAHLLEIDLTTGDRSVLSSATVPDVDGNSFDLVTDIEFDAAANRIWVLDRSGGSLFTVDAATGDRTLVSSDTVGTGAPIDTPIALGLDPAGGRAFVFTLTAPRYLLAVDAATGNRTEIDVSLTDVRSLAYDAARDAFHVIELHRDRAYTIDITTETLENLYLNTFPGPDPHPLLRGCNVVDSDVWAFTSDTIFKLDNDNRLAPVIGAGSANTLGGVVSGMDAGPDGLLYFTSTGDDDMSRLFEYDTRTSTLTTVLERSSFDEPRLSNTTIVAVDEAGTTMYAFNQAEQIVSIDTATGAFSLVSDNTIASAIDFDRPIDISFTTGGLLVTDFSHDPMIEVDLQTGVRSVSTIPAPAYAATLERDADGTLWSIGYTPDTSLYRLAASDAMPVLISEAMMPLSFGALDVEPYYIDPAGPFISCNDRGVLQFDPLNGNAVLLTK